MNPKLTSSKELQRESKGQATDFPGLLVRRVQPDLRVQKGQSARKETRVNKVFKVKLDRRAMLVLLAKLDLRALSVQKVLSELRENPAPQVLRASKVLPVQLDLPARRVKLDLWVLWDPKGLKVKSVLLDRQVQTERRVQRALWDLKVLRAKLELLVLLGLRATLERMV